MAVIHGKFDSAVIVVDVVVVVGVGLSVVSVIGYWFMPVVFGDGVSLFAGLPAKTNLTLTNTHTFKSGVVMLTYAPN